MTVFEHKYEWDSRILIFSVEFYGSLFGLKIMRYCSEPIRTSDSEVMEKVV